MNREIGRVWTTQLGFVEMQKMKSTSRNVHDSCSSYFYHKNLAILTRFLSIPIYPAKTEFVFCIPTHQPFCYTKASLQDIYQQPKIAKRSDLANSMSLASLALQAVLLILVMRRVVFSLAGVRSMSIDMLVVLLNRIGIHII